MGVSEKAIARSHLLVLAGLLTPVYKVSKLVRIGYQETRA
jgi:hypothetical protein